MRKMFPWYDSEWLSDYVAAKSLIRDKYPDKLDEFIETLKPLQTRKDFEVIEVSDFLSNEIVEACKGFIQNLDNSKKELHEIQRFGRIVVHNDNFFNQIHKSITDRVSELVKEEVEPSYNFLSLYENPGVCKVHMDAPEAKYTVDLCIEQSKDWQILASQRKDWPEDFECENGRWQQQILQDPENRFKSYSLKPGGGVIFSGSSQWHYRDRIFEYEEDHFCHLIFFHFFPKGMREVIHPSSWPNRFSIDELGTVITLTKNYLPAWPLNQNAVTSRD